MSLGTYIPNVKYLNLFVQYQALKYLRFEAFNNFYDRKFSTYSCLFSNPTWLSIATDSRC